MVQIESLLYTTLPHITEWLKGSTVYSWNVPRHFFTQAHFSNLFGEKQLNTLSGTLPNSKTPYKMLYGKKLNLAGLRELGMKVWVYDASGTKLDGRSRIGQWIGFKEVNNAHQIFWPDNHSVTVEQNIKFDNNDLLIPHALPPKGEKGEIGHKSTQDLSTTSTNPIIHNAPQQEIAEPPAKLIPENQDPPWCWF